MTYPMVLAHGVCRFDILWNESLNADNNDDPRVDRLNYFRGIRTMLKEKGYSVERIRLVGYCPVGGGRKFGTAACAYASILCRSC